MFFRAPLFLLAPLLLAAAPPPRAAPPGPPEPPERIDDGFDGALLAPGWTLFHARYGWPDKIKSLSVRDGLLRLEPFHSAWVRDLQAPFLFRTVAGRSEERRVGKECRSWW